MDLRWLRKWWAFILGASVAVGAAGGLAVREQRRVMAEIAAAKEADERDRREVAATLASAQANRAAVDEAFALWKAYDARPPPQKTHPAAVGAFRAAAAKLRGVPDEARWQAANMLEARRRLAVALHPEAAAVGPDEAILLLPPDPDACARLVRVVRAGPGDWEEVGFTRLRCTAEDGRAVYFGLR